MTEFCVLSLTVFTTLVAGSPFLNELPVQKNWRCSRGKFYYKLGLKRFPSGWVTWTEKKSPHGGWHYMQIDSRYDHLPNYEKNAVWYNDVQWFFVPSETEPGWYTLRNRLLPENVATISKSESVGSGYHIVLKRNGDPDQPEALCRPVAQGQHETGLYKLIVKSEPVGIVTWTETLVSPDVADSHFIQVDVNGEPSHRDKYVENGEWYADSLFRFEEIDRELEAEISQVELQLFPKLEEIRGLTKIDCDMVDSLIFTNVESKAVVKEIRQKMINRGQLKLKLENIPKMKIVGSAGSVSPTWYADTVDFQMAKPEVQSTEEIKLKTVEVRGISTSVVVPAWTTTEVRICREYFDMEGTEVNIGAWVYLELSERSERPLGAKGKFKAFTGKLPAEEFAYKTVKKLLALGRNDNGEIDARWESLLVAGGNSGFEEEIGSVQILGKRDTEVILKASGVIKGRFGYRGVVASN